jgi:hypothetical protein
MKKIEAKRRHPTAAKFRGEALDEFEESNWGFWEGKPGEFCDDFEDKNADATPGHGVFARLASEGDVAGLEAFLSSHPGWDVDSQDEYWRVPLHEAVGEGHLDCAKFLLDQGASVAVLGCRGESVLHVVGNFEKGQASRALVELLVARGALLERRDVWGRTPFLSVCERLCVEAAESLMELGCDSGTLDSKGRDAWDLASKSRFGYRHTGAGWSGWAEDPSVKTAFLGWLGSAWERVELADGDGAYSETASLGKSSRSKSKSI